MSTGIINRRAKYRVKMAQISGLFGSQKYKTRKFNQGKFPTEKLEEGIAQLKERVSMLEYSSMRKL